VVTATFLLANRFPLLLWWGPESSRWTRPTSCARSAFSRRHP